MSALHTDHVQLKLEEKTRCGEGGNRRGSGKRLGFTPTDARRSSFGTKRKSQKGKTKTVTPIAPGVVSVPFFFLYFFPLRILLEFWLPLREQAQYAEFETRNCDGELRSPQREKNSSIYRQTRRGNTARFFADAVLGEASCCLRNFNYESCTA